MSNSSRRLFVLGGVGLLGAGALTWSGSLVACSMSGREKAQLIRPLFVAVEDIRDADAIGRTWLKQVSTETLVTSIISRHDLTSAIMLPDDTARRRRLAEVVQADFKTGDVVLANNWVVARTEAQIAAAWLVYET